MKPSNFKRIVAYVIDIMVVTAISTFLTISIYNGKKYQETTNQYSMLLQDFSNKEISQEEYLKKTNDMVYTMNKESIVITIVTEVITIVSFVVVPYFMNGQTVGKRFMNLKIVSNDNSKITMNNYLLRALFINSILMNLIGIVTILFLKKNTYIQVNDIVTTISSAFFVVTICMILFRSDKRGLHDIIAGTKVINVSEKAEVVEEHEDNEKEKDSKLKDAELIGEKKLKM